MQRWEYYRLTVYHVTYMRRVDCVNGERLERPYHDIDALLSELGKKGWELVGMTRTDDLLTDYILKRPIQS